MGVSPDKVMKNIRTIEIETCVQLGTSVPNYSTSKKEVLKVETSPAQYPLSGRWARTTYLHIVRLQRQTNILHFPKKLAHLSDGLIEALRPYDKGDFKIEVGEDNELDWVKHTIIHTCDEGVETEFTGYNYHRGTPGRPHQAPHELTNAGWVLKNSVFGSNPPEDVGQILNY